MKPITTILAAAIVSVLAAYGTMKYNTPQNSASQETQESTYDRVMRTGIIRCGYIPIKAVLQKDEKTGALSGPGYDIIMQAGKNLGLKIEWIGESGFVSMSEDLNRGRYDMICSPIMPSAQRSRVLDFSRPLFFIPILLWIHHNDTRVTDDLSWVNDSNVKLSFVDGIVFESMARRLFPKATISSISLS